MVGRISRFFFLQPRHFRWYLPIWPPRSDEFVVWPVCHHHHLPNAHEKTSTPGDAWRKSPPTTGSSQPSPQRRHVHLLRRRVARKGRCDPVPTRTERLAESTNRSGRVIFLCERVNRLLLVATQPAQAHSFVSFTLGNQSNTTSQPASQSPWEKEEMPRSQSREEELLPRRPQPSTHGRTYNNTVLPTMHGWCITTRCTM